MKMRQLFEINQSHCGRAQNGNGMDRGLLFLAGLGLLFGCAGDAAGEAICIALAEKTGIALLLKVRLSTAK